MNRLPVVGRLLERDELRNQTYMLRNAVLREERHIFPTSESGLDYEKDGFDKHSLHIGAYCPWGRLYGSVRLVLPSPLGMPIESYCDIVIEDGIRPIAAEISRLVIPRRLPNRRRREMHANGLIALPSDIALELYRLIYQQAKARGIRYLYAAMEASLLRSLTRLHFPFHQIGPTVDYHGPVAPFVMPLDQLDLRLRRHNPALLEYFKSSPETSDAYDTEKVVKDRATA